MNRLELLPLLLQNDLTVWLEAEHPDFEKVRQQLSRFADLIKSPQHIHTYRISSLSLWNAAAMGMKREEIISFLEHFSKWDLPVKARNQIITWMERFGCLRIEIKEGKLLLVCLKENLLRELMTHQQLNGFIQHWINDNEVEIVPYARGVVKQELIALGYPVDDRAGYHCGETLPISLKERSITGSLFDLRDYQWNAVDAFYTPNQELNGSGVVVLPCGAGKTVVGIGIMERLSCATLILTSNVTSVRQWKNEILEKTNITCEQIGEYCGEHKQVRPITIATYQILTYRKMKDDIFQHMQLFKQRDWGLIIYDEVHLLPAPVFRATADIQATRRLGLTATLVREDGHEGDVFSLIGPKLHDVPWKHLETLGWIAAASCMEVLVTMNMEESLRYEAAEAKQKFRLAGENSRKTEVVLALLAKHSEEQVLIIGQYIQQLEVLSLRLNIPLITGKTPHKERERLYEKFKAGFIKRLIVSKVANFAVDLPDAAVAIQISGSFGSRQEEAQRLGRIMRPTQGSNKAYFYSLVTRNSKEELFAKKRQLFLIEQGYQYMQQDADFLGVEEGVPAEELSR
jgi:DNA excision repair protein ERCC-3